MKLYTYKGVSLSADDWATRLGISANAFRQRIDDIADTDRVFRAGYIRKPKGPNQWHGGSHSKSYYSWLDMHRRCLPSSRKRHRYYDRGIKVCKRWKLFKDFLADMGERPKGLTLDRINNNDGYKPGNCRWATPKQQGRNTSYNRLLIINGKQITLVEAAEQHGIAPDLLCTRLSRGMPLKKALIKGDLRGTKWIGYGF